MENKENPGCRKKDQDDSSPPSSLVNLSEMILKSASSKITNMPAPIPLTKSGSTWIIHIPKFFAPPGRTAFKDMFSVHPSEYQPLLLFGKQTFENRYSQLYVTDVAIGESYKYSGTTKESIMCRHDIPDQQFVLTLCEVANTIVDGLESANLVHRTHVSEEQPQQYNCCLTNWYQPEHSIGLHADEDMLMDPEVPIMSLSWGGPRRFLLRPKPKTISSGEAIQKTHEVLLGSGDLLIMGGKCQEEFKHELPRARKKDGLVDDRISWTIRSMKRPNFSASKKKKASSSTQRVRASKKSKAATAEEN